MSGQIHSIPVHPFHSIHFHSIPFHSRKVSSEDPFKSADAWPEQVPVAVTFTVTDTWLVLNEQGAAFSYPSRQ